MKFSEMPYERPDKEKITGELAGIIARAEAAGSGEELFALHMEEEKILNDFYTNMTIAMIRHTMNTADEFYEKENNFFDEFSPELQIYINRFQDILYDSPYRAFLETKIGKVAFRNMELARKSFDEKIVPLMQEENALISRYSRLIAKAKISFQGETYNLAGMTRYTHDNDRTVRKAAVKALSDYYLTVTEEIDDIYDKMVANRTAQAKALGYQSYTELAYYRMNRNCYDRKMVENLRRQVKEVMVPYISGLEEKRKARLGLEKLKFCDDGVYYKEGNPHLIGTPDEIMANALKMYRELSPETGEFMQFMMDNELFDILTRPNKEQGGYMEFIRNYKAPFVFGNFSGTYGDIALVTHECGHAFQGYLTRDEEISEFNDLTAETAETHSMSMEFFTCDWMKLFFGENEDKYMQIHKEERIAFIPYGCLVDEFQHEVYDHPELSPRERKMLWKRLEGEYLPWRDYDGDPFFGEGGFWQKQMHIFHVPFYYIDYVIAGLCAMEYKVWMDKDRKAAWESYMKFCRLSARGFFTDMLREVGLKSPFEDGCIKEIAENLL